MNDVHMSHAMEFAYPQSMGNCATCHPGTKLANVTADSFFQGTTCTSCHPVTDHSADKPTGYPTEANRAPALNALWTASNTTIHAAMFTGTTTTTDCTCCHSAAAKIAPTLSTYHSRLQLGDLRRDRREVLLVHERDDRQRDASGPARPRAA